MNPRCPGISVVIPTRDRAWCLERALSSVSNQTRQDFEVIVVDDASCDATPRLLQTMSGIHYVRLFKPGGVSRARNHGWALARGRYVCFLDSDDEWQPDKLEVQWNWMESHPHTPACYTDEIWIRNGVRVNPKKKHRKFSGDIFRQCLPLCIISPSSIMLRASLRETLGGFDETLPACEDYDLWLRLTARHRVDFIPEPLIVKYGGHSDQLSRKFRAMDCFRVYALEKILRQGGLDPEQRLWVLEMLAEKCSILETGFRHRGKLREAGFYGEAQAAYCAMMQPEADDETNVSLLGKEVLRHVCQD